ncbi:MAG TPA: hypothetical protein PLY87_18875 [Planctomycetaceae bacterium]|nr:hypothetical protein [Planctomycetaceae bacterium]HQZ67167.1 hypothetical protein [Planctomycetaceae bacterium]
MKNVIASLAILGVSGCASCQPSPAPAGIPMAGMSTTTQSTGSPCDACAAFGWRWETVSFSIPKPKMYSIPKPVAGPQVVGIPILTGGPTMTMGSPMMAQPQMMTQPQMVQPQYVQVQGQPQSSPAPQAAPQSEPQSTPASTCQPGCAEGCVSQSDIASECDDLIREIGSLQQQICVETQKASVRTKQ